MEPADQPVPLPSIPRDFSVKDVGRRMLKAACSAVPWPLGAALQEVVDLVLVEPLVRRQLDFLDSWVRRTDEQQRKGQSRDWNELAADPAFTAAVIQATRIAQTQHQREMLEALRNVLVNTAAGKPALDDDARTMLLHLLERFTPSHLVLLRFLDDPMKIVPPGGFALHRTIAQMLLVVHPDFQPRPEFREQLAQELYDMRLIKVQTLATKMSTPASNTLPLGKRLLELVADPNTWPE